jgi:small-conductance mechanosensitive channel
LNFELRVWTASFEESDRVRSDLAVAVHAALAAARIEIALPSITSIASAKAGPDG